MSTLNSSFPASLTGGATLPPILREVLRAHRATMALILVTMLVQIAMSLAAPWPLKIVIDSVVAKHRQFEWIMAILSTLAIPSFADRIVMGQVSEALTLANIAKTAGRRYAGIA